MNTGRSYDSFLSSTAPSRSDLPAFVFPPPYNRCLFNTLAHPPPRTVSSKMIFGLEENCFSQRLIHKYNIKHTHIIIFLKRCILFFFKCTWNILQWTSLMMFFKTIAPSSIFVYIILPVYTLS